MKFVSALLVTGLAALSPLAIQAETPPASAREESLHDSSIATVTDLTNTLEAVDQKVRDCKDQLMQQVVASEEFGKAMGSLADDVAAASNRWVADPTAENRVMLIDQLARFAQQGAELAGAAEKAQSDFGNTLSDLRSLAKNNLETVRVEHAEVVAFQTTVADERARIDADIERIAKNLEDLPEVLVNALDEALIHRDEIYCMAQTWEQYEAFVAAYERDIDGFTKDLGMMERQRTGLILGTLRRNFEGTAKVVGTVAALDLIAQTHSEMDELFERQNAVSADVEGLVGPIRAAGSNALQVLNQREPRTPHIDRDALRENVERFLAERRVKVTSSQ